MSPLVKKEIRLLLPAWIAAMLLAIASFALTIGNVGTVLPGVPSDLHIFFLLLGATLLGIAPFGQEFNSGTFTLSLSQPIERHRIWTIKTTLLALAYASVLLTLLVSWELHLFHLHLNWRVPWTILKNIGFSALCAFVFFSGGLCTTLLLRRISEAFWLTLLTPVILMATVFAISEYFHWPDQFNNCIVPAMFLLYSLAAFFWARRLFLRAQDLQWTGGVIAFSSRKRISTPTRVSRYPRGWFPALVWKELQLQQVNILIAAVVLALHLASVVIRQVHPNFGDPNTRGLLELIWTLWLAMPLLIGSAAVAEERRVGVTESQFCLPISRRTQFFIKFFVGLIVSLLLGGVMPFVIERAHDFNGFIFIVAAAIFFLSFYASTLARTTIQGIALAIVVAVVIYFYEVTTAVYIFRLGYSFTDERVGLELLKLYLGVPILLFVLGGLTYWNFKWLHPDGKLRWRNGIIVLASLASIFVCTNAIYFRVWELLMPIEPAHGPARLNASIPSKLLTGEDVLSALLPDGRLWTEQIGSFDRRRILPYLNTQRFIGGSNWVDAASDFYRIMGIQSDGSLWSVQTYPGWPGVPAYPLTRIGSGTNWDQVAGGHGFLLLKSDGTLWYWGVDSSSISSEDLQRYLAMQPKRIGNGTNWTEVFGRCARRSDGSVWTLSFDSDKTNSAPDLTRVDQLQSPNNGFASYASFDWWTIGVKTNGELWFVAYPEHQPYQKPEQIQLAKNAKWKAAAFAGDNSILAIREDGTLWQWPQLGKWTRNPDSAKPAQVGTYSGWIGLYSYRGWPLTCLALAADGNLWAWKDPSEHLWLAPSRKPVFIGNIFTAH